MGICRHESLKAFMKASSKDLKIVLVGGGTGGTVSPLLAVSREIRKTEKNVQFLFFGTSSLDREMVEKERFIYFAISAGKLRRYWSVQNFWIPIQLLVGFIKSYLYLKKNRPQVVFGCGSFVQVPVMYAGWLLGIPVVIHQQDVLPGLANKLCAPIARKITISLEDSRFGFPALSSLSRLASEDKVQLTGNPHSISVEDLPTQKQAIDSLGLRADFPTLLVMGGGTGALFFNELITSNLERLLKSVNVIHITGRGKSIPVPKMQGYLQMEFTLEMGLMYSASDLVLCRAGLSTITELSVLGKVALMVPMPNSHQQVNADFLASRGSAFVVQQEDLDINVLLTAIRKILHSRAYITAKERVQKLLPKDATERVAKIILQIAIKEARKEHS